MKRECQLTFFLTNMTKFLTRSRTQGSRRVGAAFMAALASVLAISGCQQVPTTTHEVQERKFDSSGILLEPVKIGPATVLVDARPAFDYSVAHVPHSLHLEWTDFTLTDPNSRGILQPDLYFLARRLAAMGIAPDTHVVVVGSGLGGGGEEGRVAWTLAVLGISKVQFTTLNALKPRFSNVIEEPSVKSVAIWKPAPIQDLSAGRDEILFAINNLGTHEAISYKAGPAKLYRIVDVRTAKAYLGREGFGAKHRVPNMDAVNIPWQEFFNAALRPQLEMVKRLNDVGIHQTDRILVIDDDGVASGAVTLALRALGFSSAGNVSGGLKDLLSSYSD